MKEPLRIIFMGTPHFAVLCLEKLLEHNYDIVGVVTAPDKRSGRGMKVQYSAVKERALERKLTILQPENLKDDEFLDDLKKLNANLQIVVAFRMLPKVVWDMPPLGTFNLHASLLPQYRGAAPINWAIMNGEKETGVSTFFLEAGVDTGQIILQKRVAISNDTSFEELYKELRHQGAHLLIKTVEAIQDGAYKSIPQESLITERLRLAPKLNKQNCRIDWSKTAVEIYNHIRGLSPTPSAWTMLRSETGEDRPVKIFSSNIIETTTPSSLAGTITVNEGRCYVTTGNGVLTINELQLSGKKRVGISDFLRGFPTISSCKFV